jgi:hypothetical protein
MAITQGVDRCHTGVGVPVFYAESGFGSMVKQMAISNWQLAIGNWQLAIGKISGEFCFCQLPTANC